MQKKFIRFIVCAGIILATYSSIGIPFVSADAPAEPSTPYPANGSNGVTIFIDLGWAGGEQGITYDVYFGTEIPPILVSENQSAALYDPGILEINTTYYWQIIAHNLEQQFTAGPLWSYTTADDQEPFRPMIIKGPKAAGAAIELYFTAIAPDPEGDNVYYQWDWNDGNISDWFGPYSFGEHAMATHLWVQNGTYDVKVRAKDIHGEISGWSSEYQISIACQIQISNLKPGYLYLNFFGFDQGWAYVYVLDLYDAALVISTEGYMVNGTVSDNVDHVDFEMMNLLYANEQWTTTDDNCSDHNCTGYFSISPGLYQTTATAFDADGHIIDRAVRQYVILYQWKFTLIKALWNKIRGI